MAKNMPKVNILDLSIFKTSNPGISQKQIATNLGITKTK